MSEGSRDVLEFFDECICVLNATQLSTVSSPNVSLENKINKCCLLKHFKGKSFEKNKPKNVEIEKCEYIHSMLLWNLFKSPLSLLKHSN